MKPKNSKRKELPVEFDKKLVGDLLRVLFNLDLAEQKLISIGMQRGDYFEDADKLWDIIFKQTIGVGHKAEMQQEDLMTAWSDFESRFQSREEFDPEEFVAWLSAGQFKSFPFERERRGIWAFKGGCC